jgi:cytochrome c oxidase cbb3-type subunit III
MRHGAALMILAAGLCACSPEARTVGPTMPRTQPANDRDPRIAAYQDNFYQVAQGGRYFGWYGCSGCHTDTAPGVLNLPDGQWRHGSGFAQVYGAIADRHGTVRFRDRIPVEPLWQLTAFVRDLSRHTPEKRRRLQVDQQAEPIGPSWTGPQ